MPFREQLELDSMDFLDIVMELRKRYRMQIPEDDYSELGQHGQHGDVPRAADEGHAEGLIGRSRERQPTCTVPHDVDLVH